MSFEEILKKETDRLRDVDGFDLNTKSGSTSYLLTKGVDIEKLIEDCLKKEAKSYLKESEMIYCEQCEWSVHPTDMCESPSCGRYCGK